MILQGTSPALDNALDSCRLVPGLDYGAGLRGNSMGYPGPDPQPLKRPGKVRMAVLGDSFAVGPVVPFADNYVTLLERHLPATEVLNFGVSGAGPREYAYLLKRDVLRFQPDLVLVSIFVTNDVMEVLPTPRRLDPRQHCLYWLCRRCLRRATAVSWTDPAGSDALLAHRIATGTLSPESFAEIEAYRLAVCQVPAPSGVEKKWQCALQDLEAVIKLCRREKTGVAFVLIPDEAQADPSSLDLVRQGADLEVERLDLQLPQRRLREFCRRQGVPCLDLLPAFAGRTGLYVQRNTHWNREGNHLAAREIAQWLGATGIAGISPPASSRQPPAPENTVPNPGYSARETLQDRLPQTAAPSPPP
jgi:hypothetical protein